MNMQISINKLRFGHDHPKAVNARVSGRLVNIETMAASLKKRGMITPPTVFADLGEFWVSNGNRRLAGLHLNHGKDSEIQIECNLREVDAAGAFEDSITDFELSLPLHPVDRYEAFARLEQDGKSEGDISDHFGIEIKDVRRALALGRLSPKIRDAWRKGEIKQEVAQTFTLAKDQKVQDKVFGKLSKGKSLDVSNIREAIGIKSNRAAAQMLQFVTADVYRAAGGSVVEDLFTEMSAVSDEALLKQLFQAKLDDVCEQLVKEGWSWANLEADLESNWRSWPQRHYKTPVYLGDEEKQLATLAKQKRDNEDSEDDYDDELDDRLIEQMQTIEEAIDRRSFPDAQRKKLGCIVDFHNGKLDITFGIERLVAKPMPVKSGRKPSSPAAAAPAPKPQTTISNAMKDRLESQLLKATIDALNTEKHASPLAGVLAAIVAGQIRPEGYNHTPLFVMNKLAAVRAEISPAVMNAAVLKRFDAKDYFGGAPKPVLLKAIGEAVSADQARKLGEKTKSELVKFCNANVAKTSWLPKELRTPHYDGPGSGKKKETPKPKAAAKKAAKKKARP